MNARFFLRAIMAFGLGALLVPFNFAKASCNADHEEEIHSCPKIPLTLTPICALDAITAQWKVTNTNPLDVSFVATVDCADEQLANRIQTFSVPANAELVFETPRTQFGCGFLEPTVSIYVFGHLDDVETIPTAVVDSCGVCGGNDSTKGCDGVCSSGKTTDICGVCGGDGSTCPEDICTQQGPSGEETKSANKTKKFARIVRNRTRNFANKAKRCNGVDLSRFVSKANSLYAQIVATLDTQFTNTQLVCLSSICTAVNTTDLKIELRKISNRLVSVQKRTKTKAIEACGRVESSAEDTRKNTEDYRNLLLSSVSNLAEERLSCTAS